MPIPYEPPSDHRIRLRGPWDAVWLDCPAGHLAEAPSRSPISLPASRQDLFGDRIGTVRLSRRFGRPSGLENGEQVWLELAVQSEVSALWNGEWLGTTSAGVVRFDVTGRLDWRNRLDLDLKLEEPASSSKPIVEVALIIVENWD